VTASWALVSLTELIASLADPDDADLISGIERMAETLDAEIAALCSGSEVAFSVGFGTFASPDTELLEMAHSSDRGCVVSRHR
jgi:hypothetical protein